MKLLKSQLNAFNGKLIKPPENLSKDNYRWYATFNYVMFIGIFVHVVLFFTFLYLKVFPLAYFNIFSVTTWTIVLNLNLRGHFFTAICLATFEILAHSVTCIVIIGLNSGFHLYLFTLIIACYFVPVRRSFLMTLLSLVFILSCVLLNFYSYYFSPLMTISNNLSFLFLSLNLTITGIVLSIIGYFYANSVKKAETELEKERQKSDNLLHNIIPPTIADRLKTSPEKIADGFQATTILFSDIVGFTPFSKKVSPEELVNILNQIFSIFDALTDKYGLEKIKTIGDAYMVAGGIPNPRDDHAEAIANMALDMNEEIIKFNGQNGHTFQIRTGIHSGEAVAGVIGIKKFIYDLWGDTVNTASRMESHGLPGEIQVSEQTYELLKDSFAFEERGEIDVKGKGLMKTYLLKTRM